MVGTGASGGTLVGVTVVGAAVVGTVVELAAEVGRIAPMGFTSVFGAICVPCALSAPEVVVRSTPNTATTTNRAQTHHHRS